MLNLGTTDSNGLYWQLQFNCKCNSSNVEVHCFLAVLIFGSRTVDRIICSFIILLKSVVHQRTEVPEGNPSFPRKIQTISESVGGIVLDMKSEDVGPDIGARTLTSTDLLWGKREEN